MTEIYFVNYYQSNNHEQHLKINKLMFQAIKKSVSKHQEKPWNQVSAF